MKTIEFPEFASHELEVVCGRCLDSGIVHENTLFEGSRVVPCDCQKTYDCMLCEDKGYYFTSNEAGESVEVECENPSHFK